MSTEVECTMPAAAEGSQVFGEFMRYVVVGGIAAVADLSVLYVAAVQIQVHYLTAGLIAFLVGLTINYILSVTWAFRHRSVENRLVEFAIFAAVGVAGLGLNEAVLYLFTGLLALHVMLSKLVAVATVFMWNFGARKLILFRKTA